MDIRASYRELHVVRSPLARFILNNPSLTITLIFLPAAFIGISVWFFTTESIGNDFSVYWRTANEPSSNAYLPRSSFPFPYAPTMLLWIQPLKFFPFFPAFISWALLSTLLVWFVCRTHLSRAECAVVLFSPPLVNGLATGQVSAVLAALLILACTIRNRFIAGTLLGIIASIKPQLVLFAPVLLAVQNDWRGLAASALTFFGFILLSVQLFGLSRWFEWAHSLVNFREVLRNDRILEAAVTPAALADNYDLSALPFLLGGTIVGLWLILRCRNSAPITQSAAIAGSSLLAAPYALQYDLAPLVPFLVWSIFRNSLASAFALSGALNPLPLLLSAYALNKIRRGPTDRQILPNTTKSHSL